MYGEDLKVYFDTEFTGLHRDTTLISIGMVSENGSYFYAELTDYDESQVNEWLQDHVINNLFLSEDGVKVYKDPITNKNSMTIKGPKNVVRHHLEQWLQHTAELPNPNAVNRKIQLYTDCYAYDWMLFNDLICDDGLALNLPPYINYIPMDLSTLLSSLNIDPDITREEFIGEHIVSGMKDQGPFLNMEDSIKHNSLWDAYVCKICFDKCRSILPRN